MLLHQQHPDPGVGDDPPNSSFNVLNNVGLNALGGLIQQQQLWLAKQRTGDGQLLLLTPTQIAAFARQKLLKDRKQLVNEWIDMAIPRQSTRHRLHPQEQVFFHRELGDDLATLRHITNPGPSPLMRCLTIQLRTVKRHGSGAGAQQTDQRFQQGGFAHTIAADQTNHLSRVHAEINIPKNVTFSVKRVETLDLQQVRHWFSSSVVPR